MRLPKRISFVFVIALAGALAGLLYAELTHGRSLLAGMIYGFCISICVSGAERGIFFAELQQRMRRWPTLLYIPACEAASVVLVSIGFALGGLINWSTGLLPIGLAEATIPTPQIMIYALIVAGVLVFITRVRDLLGREVFASLLLGRYHRPVEEKRIFLFLDLVGSTAYAHTHGDLRAQEYLGAIYAEIAEPVRKHSGTIDDYIGDLALITWPARRGLRDANCVEVIFSIFERIERNALWWQRHFGEVPRFHAALHGGMVVTAEVGIDRHKISYFGDVVNTTARIESLCRTLASPVLISADLLRDLHLPDGITAHPLGHHPIRGRDQMVELYGLDRSRVEEERRFSPASRKLRLAKA